jgi:hypothetical protein
MRKITAGEQHCKSNFHTVMGKNVVLYVVVPRYELDVVRGSASGGIDSRHRASSTFNCWHGQDLATKTAGIQIACRKERVTIFNIQTSPYFKLLWN